jgi:hypothetical protein
MNVPIYMYATGADCAAVDRAAEMLAGHPALAAEDRESRHA